MSRKCLLPLTISLFILLTGCWNSIEMDDVIMVMGAGFDQTDGGYELSVEMLQSTRAIGPEEAQTDSMVITHEGETLFDAVRGMILKTKRRLFFTHTNIYVMSETLAKQNLSEAMDIVRRDQMPRLNSMFLITPESPKEILDTTTVTQDLVSIEMAESMLGTRFTSQFSPMEIRKVFEMLSGPVPASFIPIIEINRENEAEITEMTGTAIIKNDKMVGQLNVLETKGLLYLREEAGDGSVTTEMDSGDKLSIEALGQTVDVKPTLHGEQLTVDIDMHLEGELSEIPSQLEVDETTIPRMEQEITEKCREKSEMTLHKLQQEFKTDVLGFGLEVYRKYPQQWQEIKDDWDDIFAEADIQLNVTTSINHKGLMNQNKGGIFDKPQWIPFKFLDQDTEK